MARQRARLTVEVDLDPVDGWGNDPEDWQRMLQHYLRQIAGHYNPTVEIVTPLAGGESNGEAPDLREQDCPSADVCLNGCDLHPTVEPPYCPFKGRCEHVACLIDVDQCASALMASVRCPPAGGEGRG